MALKLHKIINSNFLLRVNKAQRNSGMTILELVTVIGIVAILAAIGIPNYISWLPKYRAGTAIRQLYTEMQAAKQRAITENNDFKVTFLLTSPNRYEIYNDGVLGKTVIIGDSAPGIVIDSVTFIGNSVTFYPTGLSSPAGEVILKPGNDDTKKKKIEINTNGRIKIVYQL